jgi:TonB family protein
MLIRRVVLVFALAVGFIGTASAQSLEQLLTSQYHDKTFLLRHSFKKRSQEYSPEGTLVGGSEEGPWTVDGSIVVKKIKVQGDRVTIEGKRALYVFDKTGSMKVVPDDRKHPAEDLKIVLHSLQPVSTVDDAALILGRVLALTGEDSVKSVPVYWQSTLAKSLGVQVLKETGSQNAGRAAAERSGDGKVYSLYDLDKNSLAKPLYSPEPEFTDTARSWKFQGVVGLNIIIDSTGKVRTVSIVHPLGMGLDDNAVATVSTWRFAPAQREGQPVAVSVYVEVDFHLY